MEHDEQGSSFCSFFSKSLFFFSLFCVCMFKDIQCSEMHNGVHFDVCNRKWLMVEQSPAGSA